MSFMFSFLISPYDVEDYLQKSFISIPIMISIPPQIGTGMSKMGTLIEHFLFRNNLYLVSLVNHPMMLATYCGTQKYNPKGNINHFYVPYAGQKPLSLSSLPTD